MTTHEHEIKAASGPRKLESIWSNSSLHSAIWSAAATTPLWLCVHAGCAVRMGPRVSTAKAVSPSEADSSTALQTGRPAAPGRYVQS